ncbi:hypothetical protein DYBT9275_00552 [Dyadobacter sp. CECT 9275]|uniref:Uncharacterized protein n=1 Tax=Dyadobacter helix TaxID=2822344 RepID=A0A916J8J6_9BACT|nr:hypothetical protein [Dyadobacter sp. CECT 9275]CAG4990536.1 hypothetical protein DYBT9275_00552 [Dyadobacter sp. CECT 9275]
MNTNNLSVFLDVALSLTFFYLVASMFVSGITEFINTLLDKRAKLLKEALDKLVVSDQSFMQHPLIVPFRNPRWKIWNNSISYISSKTFVSVILSSLSTVGSASNLAKLDAQIQGLASGTLKEILTVISKESKDLDEFRQKLAEWFDAYMVQVTDWYKRSTRIVLWVVALAVSVCLNLNSISITKRLYTDPVLRNQMVQKAMEAARDKDYSHFEKGNEEKFLTYLGQKDSTLADTVQRIHITSHGDSVVVAACFREYIKSDSIKMESRHWIDTVFINSVKKYHPTFVKSQLTVTATSDLDLLQVKEEYAFFLQNHLTSLGLPIGWKSVVPESVHGWKVLRVFFTLLAKNLLGWLLTAAALSFGAPFWFDLLVKLVNIRNVGNKPEPEKGK